MAYGLSSALKKIEPSTPAGESPGPCAAAVPPLSRSGGVDEDADIIPRRWRYDLVERPLKELHLHPVLEKHGVLPLVKRLSEVAKSWDQYQMGPISTTCDGKVMKGLEEFDLARRKGMKKVRCLDYDLDAEEQIRWILDNNRKTEGLIDFLRIEIALELKPSLVERAQEHMRLGGSLKGLANLPKAQRINVRDELRKAANVAEHQVSRVEVLLRNAQPELLMALRSGEVSINRAWIWVTEHRDSQLDQLEQHRIMHGETKDIDGLLRRHTPTQPHAGNGYQSSLRFASCSY
jgi:hypothetical protein